MEYSFRIKYYVYIVTDDTKSFLEVGVTGDLSVLINKLETKNVNHACQHLIYWERFETPSEVLAREEQLNKLSKKKISKLIDKHNPGWQFLNDAYDEKDLFYRVN